MSTSDSDKASCAAPARKTTTNSSTEILRNCVYIGYHAPDVDEYHKSIFITHPPTLSGTLFHAIWRPASTGWECTQQPVAHVAHVHGLVLLFRIGTFTAHTDMNSPLDPVLEAQHAAQEWFGECEEVLVGTRTEPRVRGDEEEGVGVGVERTQPGHGCRVWSVDAVKGLADAGLLDLGGETAEQVVLKGRLIAGPADAKAMVGKDHGPLRVVN